MGDWIGNWQPAANFMYLLPFRVSGRRHLVVTNPTGGKLNPNGIEAMHMYMFSFARNGDEMSNVWVRHKPLVPADKAANNVVVVWRLHYINTLIQELGSTKTYERTSTDEKAIVDDHCCHTTTKFAVGISENQEQLPTLYWLTKLHKRPYKSRYIANSNSCTTTELSKLLTSCLTAVKNDLIKYYDTCYERDGINHFWSNF